MSRLTVWKVAYQNAISRGADAKAARAEAIKVAGDFETLDAADGRPGLMSPAQDKAFSDALFGLSGIGDDWNNYLSLLNVEWVSPSGKDLHLHSLATRKLRALGERFGSYETQKPGFTVKQSRPVKCGFVADLSSHLLENLVTDPTGGALDPGDESALDPLIMEEMVKSGGSDGSDLIWNADPTDVGADSDFLTILPDGGFIYQGLNSADSGKVDSGAISSATDFITLFDEMVAHSNLTRYRQLPMAFFVSPSVEAWYRAQQRNSTSDTGMKNITRGPETMRALSIEVPMFDGKPVIGIPSLPDEYPMLSPFANLHVSRVRGTTKVYHEFFASDGLKHLVTLVMQMDAHIVKDEAFIIAGDGLS